MRAGQRSIPARYLSIVIECPLPGLDNGWISLPFSRTFRLAYVMNVSWGRSRGRVRIDRINMSDMCALCVDSCQTVIVCVCLIWASVDAVIVSPSWSCDVERVSSFDPSFLVLDARGELRRLKPYFYQEDYSWTEQQLSCAPLLFLSCLLPLV